MRIWFKIFKDNRMQKDLCLTDDRDDTRTHKIFHALDATPLTLVFRSG